MQEQFTYQCLREEGIELLSFSYIGTDGRNHVLSLQDGRFTYDCHKHFRSIARDVKTIPSDTQYSAFLEHELSEQPSDFTLDIKKAELVGWKHFYPGYQFFATLWSDSNGAIVCEFEINPKDQNLPVVHDNFLWDKDPKSIQELYQIIVHEAHEFWRAKYSEGHTIGEFLN